MTDNLQAEAAQLVASLNLDEISEWLETQRWYGSKSRHITGIEIDESVTLSASPPLLLNLVQTRFATGAHDLYQLPLSFWPIAEAATRTGIVNTPESVVLDAVADPELVRDLLRLMEGEASLDGEAGCFRFARVQETGPLTPDAPVRPIGVEQSNSSIVFGEDTVLKVFRKLELQKEARSRRGT